LKVSLIVTTYNWPEALDKVLCALSAQQFSPTDLEIIVADDGSTEATAECIRVWQDRSPFSLVHCWQPDEGFQAAKIRNRAAAKAQHEYLIFLDGDCVPFPSFVKTHVALAERGWFVSGNRVLLNPDFTKNVFTRSLLLHRWGWRRWAGAITKKCNRVLPFLRLPLGRIRKIAAQRWQGAKTCNIGVWRDDFMKVNGLEERFVGWGFEDSEWVIRLQRAGVLRKLGHFALPVLHLWHPSIASEKNIEQLRATQQSQHTRARQGVDQYL